MSVILSVSLLPYSLSLSHVRALWTLFCYFSTDHVARIVCNTDFVATHVPVVPQMIVIVCNTNFVATHVPVVPQMTVIVCNTNDVVTHVPVLPQMIIIVCNTNDVAMHVPVVPQIILSASHIMSCWNCIEGSVGEASDRRGGALMGFHERIDIVLNWTELNSCHAGAW